MTSRDERLRPSAEQALEQKTLWAIDIKDFIDQNLKNKFKEKITSDNFHLDFLRMKQQFIEKND